MHFKGFIAVAVFFSALVATHSVNGSQPQFTWTHGVVMEGADVVITVEDAPCQPVTVTLQVNGQTVTGTISSVPGRCTIRVPEETSGEAYTITVKCPDDADSDTGQVF